MRVVLSLLLLAAIATVALDTFHVTSWKEATRTINQILAARD